MKRPLGVAVKTIAHPLSVEALEAIRNTKMKYGIRKVRPPHMDTMTGKRQILPIPTAEPMQATTKPNLFLNVSL